jgi:hypothetical protein
MQAAKAVPLVAPVDAAHFSRGPAWEAEVKARSMAAQIIILMVSFIVRHITRPAKFERLTRHQRLKRRPVQRR